MIALSGLIVGFLWQILPQAKSQVPFPVVILMCFSLSCFLTLPNLVFQIFLQEIQSPIHQKLSLFQKCKQVTNNFEVIQKAFSCYFFVFFSSSQFMIIFQIFMTYQYLQTLSFASSWQMICSIFLQILSMILTLMATTNSVDETYDMKGILRKEIQIAILHTKNENELKELEFWKNEIDMLKPMNASGYFEIDKTTLTSMLSVRCHLAIVICYMFCNMHYAIIPGEFNLI